MCSSVNQCGWTDARPNTPSERSPQVTGMNSRERIRKLRRLVVVRGADGRDVAGLGEEIVRLATAARERKAKPDELRGQTFTVSNIGAVGGRYGTPLVPYGTTAILSVGRADPTPVVRDGEIVVGREMPLSLSYDHRAIDGSTGRAFMAAVVEALEAWRRTRDPESNQ